MTEQKEVKKSFRAWMPIQKSSNGEFTGILSDTSLDRDNEFMTKELLESWASTGQSLPMLANHENKMEKFIGGWTEKKLINKGENYALTAKPFFFSKEASPLAAQIKKQIEEALDNGLDVGISIGALPTATVEKEINGVKRTGYSEAEIVEATICPVQSNRGASFAALAKSFDLNKEEVKMEEIKKEDPAPVQEEIKETPAEPVVPEAPAEVEETETPAEPEVNEELEAEKAKNAKLQKELTELKEKIVNKKPLVEEPLAKKPIQPDEFDGSMESLYKNLYGTKEE